MNLCLIHFRFQIGKLQCNKSEQTNKNRLLFEKIIYYNDSSFTSIDNRIARIFSALHIRRRIERPTTSSDTCNHLHRRDVAFVYPSIISDCAPIIPTVKCLKRLR